MIKLSTILSEKIIRIPPDILNKSKELFDYINQNMDELIENAPESMSNPYIALQEFFDFPNPYTKQSLDAYIIVDIGFFNDPNKRTLASMSVEKMKGGDYWYILAINLANIPNNYNSFKDVIEHELVHAVDPKIKLRFGTKSQSTPTKPGYEAYIKSPEEFDAFTTNIISNIKDNLETVTYKAEYKRMLFKLLSEIKTESIESIIVLYSSLDFLFSRRQDARLDFYNSLRQIKYWTTKPTLYKRFLQRLYNEIKNVK